MVPADRNVPTVTTIVVDALPQGVMTLYVIVSMPGLIPVSRPVAILTLAEPLLLLHVPPVTVLLSGVTVPEQILVGPTIVPALGVVFAVTTWVAAINPQLLETL